MVYLIHFDQPYKHAKHYIGYARGGLKEVLERMDRHRKGQGANLMRVVVEAGIGFTLVGTKRGGRTEERRIKGRGIVCKCHICTPGSTRKKVKRLFKPRQIHFDPATGMQCNILQLQTA